MFMKPCTWYGSRPNSGGRVIGSWKGARQSQGRMLLPDEMALPQVSWYSMGSLSVGEILPCGVLGRVRRLPIAWSCSFCPLTLSSTSQSEI